MILIQTFICILITGCSISDGKPGNGKVQGTCEKGLFCQRDGECKGIYRNGYVEMITVAIEKTIHFRLDVQSNI